MQALTPSFMLLPDFSYPPDKDLQLGSILLASKQTKLPDPAEILNSGSRVPIDDSSIIKRPFKDWNWEGTKSGSFNAALWTNLSTLSGIGGGVGSQRGNDSRIVIKSKHVDVLLFRPDQAYLARVVSDSNVEIYTRRIIPPPLYLVTGLMIAHGASIEVGRSKNGALDLELSVDATPVQVPVKVGPKIGFSKAETSAMSTTIAEDFILAYQLISLRKKRDKTVDVRRENKWALFSDGRDRALGEVDGTLRQVLEDWDLAPLTFDDVRDE